MLQYINITLFIIMLSFSFIEGVRANDSNSIEYEENMQEKQEEKENITILKQEQTDVKSMKKGVFDLDGLHLILGGKLGYTGLFINNITNITAGFPESNYRNLVLLCS